MMILDIVTKLYESKYFTLGLIIVTLCLILMFVLILLKGLKDLKKQEGKEVINPTFEEKDITFEEQPEETPEFKPIINEDVTFEAPNLTQNLADFKNIIEQEIKQEDSVEVKPLEKIQPIHVVDDKPIKILDIDEIEDTSIFPIFDTDSENDIQSDFAFQTNDDNKISLDINTVS